MEHFDTETLVLFGVWWNAILQTIWFIWSIDIVRRKHQED